MVFTSPSSARGNLDEEDTPEPQLGGRRRKTPSKRPSVAVQLRMNGQVTARAIAYSAVQVCAFTCYASWLSPLTKLHFSLNDASHWMSHYNGFNYEEFYEFIVDFFEEDQTPEGKAAANELFSWWNKYASNSVSPFYTTYTTTDVCFHAPPPPEALRPDLQGGRHSRCCDDSAKHASDIPSHRRNRVVLIYMFI